MGKVKNSHILEPLRFTHSFPSLFPLTNKLSCCIGAIQYNHNNLYECLASIYVYCRTSSHVLAPTNSYSTRLLSMDDGTTQGCEEWYCTRLLKCDYSPIVDFRPPRVVLGDFEISY